ncbi:ROT1 protein [Coprinopsis marcescibilis]|uniref:Protein ROT1 n=1 Tax=Coprinopsis marcescibilis TaxID=230819 RepID=A0A5C3LGI9_COPMA|nr:ROT1 protein [Coprinopsis marcescibilis]
MILTPLAAVVLASLARFTTAQDTDPLPDIDFNNAHNATVIYGTWSTGSTAVRTGPAFVDPATLLFNYPPNTGESYSFTEDGYYEIARYRFNSNATDPRCIQGVMVWVHGEYTLNSNGTITMDPFPDGFQQVQDPCAAESNFIETYNFRETFVQWRIFNDRSDGYKLHLFRFDGSPVAPQFLVSETPTMHPTRPLRNETWIRVDGNQRRSLPEDEILETRSAASPTRSFQAGGVAAAAGALVLALSSFLL